MIFTDRTITVRKGESRIDEPIVVYRGDYELEVRFTILNSRFKFMSGTNMIESEKASYGQLAILTPYGGNIFSDIVRCNDGSVTFVLTAEMLNQIEEVGLYSFQIRLMDYNKESRVSIPPIEFGIEVREPIASEDHDNSVNNAIVGYSIAKVVDPKEENVGDTFDESGNYNKTNWETGDRISEGKLNKIEDAIDKVNKNEMNNSALLSKRIDNNFSVLDSIKAEQTELDVLINRVDTLVKLENGSTTGDAELIDARIGYDGVEYSCVGESIRNQCSDIHDSMGYIKEFSVGNNDIPTTYVDGKFLATDGMFRDDDTTNSKFTDKIPCCPGWIFSYKGQGKWFAASWVMYKGNNLVSSGQIVTNEGYSEVIIPEGVDGIVFSSFSKKDEDEDVILEVELLSNRSISKDNLTANLTGIVRYCHLDDELKNTINTGRKDLIMDKRDGYYLSYKGQIHELDGYYYYEIDVNEGDVFYYYGDLRYEIGPYAFYDDAYNVLFVGGDNQPSSNLRTVVFDDIMTPAGATKMRIGCYDNLTFYKKVPISTDEVTYKNAADHKDILTCYNVIKGKHFLNANGELKDNEDSEYVRGILINDYKTIYVSAKSKYYTCIMCIFDKNMNLLGNKGAAIIDGETIWDNKPFEISELLKEFPTAHNISLCSYDYLNHPLVVTTTDGTMDELCTKIDNILELNGSNWSVLYGKKWVAFGDSLTEFNTRATKNYHDYIAEDTGITVINFGVGGSGYKKREEDNKAFYQRMLNIPADTDIVTIFGSGNDLSLTLGSPSDTGTDTICGCIHQTIQNLFSVNPGVRVGIVLPCPWGNYPPSISDNKMALYCEALKEIASYYSIPVLDLYHGSNLRPWDDEFRSLYYKHDDGNTVHPDEDGHALLANKFKMFIMSL